MVRSARGLFRCFHIRVSFQVHVSEVSDTDNAWTFSYSIDSSASFSSVDRFARTIRRVKRPDVDDEDPLSSINTTFPFILLGSLIQAFILTNVSPDTSSTMQETSAISDRAVDRSRQPRVSIMREASAVCSANAQPNKTSMCNLRSRFSYAKLSSGRTTHRHLRAHETAPFRS